MNRHITLFTLAIAPLFLILVLATGLQAGEESLSDLKAGPAAALFQTRYVGPTGNDAGDCTSFGNPCQTISYAISRANPGDTVLVKAGTYTEGNISVDRDLDIVGVGVNKTIVQLAAAPHTAAGSVFMVERDVKASIQLMKIRHGNAGSFSGKGGGIHNLGRLTVDRAWVANNAAAIGAGIFNGGRMTVTLSTIEGNDTDGQVGGGIANGDNFEGAYLKMINSTVSGNIGSYGGGLFIERGSEVEIYNSTFSDNFGSLGGTIKVLGAPGETTRLTMENSIITRSLNGDCDSLYGTFYGGNNLFDDYLTTECTGLSSSPPLNVDPQLMDNGGYYRAPTHALLPGSNAIDTGRDDCTVDGFILLSDQRGLYRHRDGNGDGVLICDVGAYELGRDESDTDGPVDLVALALEVTQGIQDMTNRVRLVAGKPTFVRFHVWSRSGSHATGATLKIQEIGTNRRVTLTPINPIGPAIPVTEVPDRADLNQSFLFQIPASFLQGELSLTAVVNPDFRNPVETDDTNNTFVIESIRFEQVPNLFLVFYRYSYEVDGVRYDTDQFHVNQMVDWLERAFPTPSVSYTTRTYLAVLPPDAPVELGVPPCRTINGLLSAAKYWDIMNDAPVPFGSHYVGMVQDDGGFMRGCAPVPGAVAATPVGDANWGWDFDGSYADWYGGHELAHAYNRPHANFCGATGGGFYPYANGEISPTDRGLLAMYGFDIGTLEVYPPTWKDVMTYCDNLWVSDYNYHKLMDWFQNNPVNDPPAAAAAEDAVDRLVVFGFIDADTGKVSMNNMFVLPDAPNVLPRTPGPLSIILLDGEGNKLADYPFTPDIVEGGRSAPATVSLPGRDVSGVSIREAVPFITGTETVEIRGPQGGLLFSLSPGPASPVVEVLSPNGGEVLPGDTITLTWSAEDPDGDIMRYNVQYSADNGASWQVVAQGLSTTTVVLDRENLPASNQGLIRVWATDGFHTGRDVSDSPFVVPNRPPLGAILRPAAPITVAVSQTVNFRGEAYDLDSGRLRGAQLTWYSDLDGPLGEGNRLGIAALSVGTHLVTFQGDDGDGGVVTDTVQVTVLSDPALLPNPDDALLVAPGLISFEPQADRLSDRMYIYNQNPANAVISWTATVDQPWVGLERSSGSSPDSIAVTFNGSLLPTGLYTATITITSPDLPGLQTKVPVTLRVDPFNVYVPMIAR